MIKRRMSYDHSKLEKKWQDFWLQNKIFKTETDILELKKKPKYYVLDMFPYPSGSGLHVGHVEGYTGTDIVARYKRMTGHHVLHPTGWDAFGLPAEQNAINTGKHPKITTKENTDNFRRQMRACGFSYDWDREINTTDPKYYRWTQKIFSILYKKGLAYQAEIPVNWCPALGTVLANEEVIDGKSERGRHPVIRKPMKQWMLKITAFADKLVEDLEGLDWPESIKMMQRNWVGKSVGARVKFQIEGHESFEVFTTRPDTLYGATYCVLAPEHLLVSKITSEDQKSAVEKYLGEVEKKSDLERTELNKDKTGVFTGAFAINPLTNDKIPIWISDYVLATYGTGSIMCVPAHDERDFEFAQKFQLPIKQVVKAKSGETKVPFTESGISINSSLIDSLETEQAKEKIILHLEKNGLGKSEVQYKLRDWLFARQRYWGEPFPIVFDEQDKPHLLPESELPLILPEMNDFKPSGSGEGPLAKATDWVVYKKDGKIYRRETNTMPQWAGSCWYYLRFIDVDNTEAPFDKEMEKYWLPVDLYVGGAEHAVLHLLYSRFWHKVLYEEGLVSTKEPFKKLFNQGMIFGEDGNFMSKSLGNVVDPVTVIDEHGADSLRLYEMFLGPFDKNKPWNSQGIQGVSKFIKRVWNAFIEDTSGENKLRPEFKEETATEEQLRALHKCIHKVTSDIESLQFNTAISAMMIFMNEFVHFPTKPKRLAKDFLKVLSPFAPHVTEELNQFLGYQDCLSISEWPKVITKYLVEDTFTLVIQVNGKLRDTFQAAIDITQEEALEKAKTFEKVMKSIDGLQIKKVIFVPKKLLNIVVG